MKMFLFVLILFVSLNVSSQQVKTTSPPAQKMLILKKTWVVASGENSFRIITNDDTIAHKLRSKFEYSDITRMTYNKKKNNEDGSLFWERTFYFKNESWNTVVLYINNGFK